MVVIPARPTNPAISERWWRSLPPDSVIVVDDHSQDSTAEEAREAGAGVIQARICCARDPEKRMPHGRRPGTHVAMDSVRRRGHAFSPGFLNAAVAWRRNPAESRCCRFISTPTTRASVSACLRRIDRAVFCGADPRSDPVAAFNGQCMLARRDAYRFLGGHAAGHNSVSEEVRLAAAARRHRLTLESPGQMASGTVSWRDLGGAVERGAFRFHDRESPDGRHPPGRGRGDGCLDSDARVAVGGASIWCGCGVRGRALVASVGMVWTRVGVAAVLGLPVAIYAALPMLWAGLVGGAESWRGRMEGQNH